MTDRCHCPGCPEPIEEAWADGSYGEELATVCAGCAGRFPCLHDHLVYECHRCGQLDPGIAPDGSEPVVSGAAGAGDEMSDVEINRIMREIEKRYRDDRENWGMRIGAISRPYTEQLLRRVAPFSTCRTCRNHRGATRHGFCQAHASDAERIVVAFWERATPWGTSPMTCPECLRPMATAVQEARLPRGAVRPIRTSVDHIRPISLGGLEWDRDNLRWCCLSCNSSRGNRHKALPGKQGTLVSDKVDE